MSNEEKAKVLEKIKKCLALGKSSNEHEAAAALRQAQKLMEKYNVTEEDLEGVEYVINTVVTDYEFGKKKPLIILAVANLIQHAMGVEVIMSGHRKGNGWNHAVIYAGPRHRVTIAEYAHAVVYRAVAKSWREYLKANPHVRSVQGARAGFYTGWCEAVRAKVQALVLDPKEQEGTQRAIARRFGELGKAKTGGKMLGSTMMDGAYAAKDFELNKPLGKDTMRIGHES